MTQQGLEKETIAHLRAMAKTKGIRLHPALRKAEIVRLLLATESPVAKKEKTPAPPLPESASKIDRPVSSSDPVVPQAYGLSHVVALVRDPWWIYAYWEVTQESLAEANRKCADDTTRLTLRIYNVTFVLDTIHFWDIEVYHRIGNWYIDVGQPDEAYFVEIGVKSPAGLFVAIARSGVIRTPTASISGRLDEEWWTLEPPLPARSYESGIPLVSYADEGRRLPLDLFKEESAAASVASSSGLSSLNRPSK